MSAAKETLAHSAADAEMSLSQLLAAIFSILIATLDSTECMLEVVSFSELSVFVELLFVNVLQELPQDQ